MKIFDKYTKIFTTNLNKFKINYIEPFSYFDVKTESDLFNY